MSNERNISQVESFVKSRKAQENFARFDRPKVEEPQIALGRVVSFDPITGSCRVFLLSFEQEIEAIVLGSANNVCGTKYDRVYDADYYEKAVHGEGKKRYEYVTEGVQFSLPIDALVVVLCTAGFLPWKEGYTTYVILGTISFPQVEGAVGPRRNAEKTARIGNWGKLGKVLGKVKVKEGGYIDEVGYNSRYRSEMAEDFTPETDKPKEFIPHMSPDIYHSLRIAARAKERVNTDNGIYGKAVPRTGGRYRFGDRERLDATRIIEKYHINKQIRDEVEVRDIADTHSELLLKFDKQGRILLAADLEETLVECYCSDESKYSGGNDFDPGTFVAMGRSAGVRYVEISSRDWMLTRYRRGVSRFDGYHREHAHDFGNQNRKSFLSETKVFVKEEDLDSHDGIFYGEYNELVLNVGHLQITADRMLIDVDPKRVYWKQLDLFGDQILGLSSGEG